MASKRSIIYETAKYIAEILSPLVSKNGYALNNSAEIVSEFKNFTLRDIDVLFFYVTPLFTKVSIDKSLEIIFDQLENDPSLTSPSSLTPANIRDLLNICLKKTYFIYDFQIYTHVEGASMGSPMSPTVADLYMELFEETTLQSFTFNIYIWKRFVDYTFVALCGSLIEDLTEHINSINLR